MDKSMQNTELDVDYNKIINREVIRLRMSLEAAKKLQEGSGKEILVFFHFPPVWGDYVCEDIISLLKEYGIEHCFFGHIHGVYAQPGSFVWEGIHFRMISADYLKFLPYRIG